MTLRGFRSIKEMALELGPMNVLIGENGVGKSNLVSFFKLLNEMMGERLQQYVAESGRAQANLHFGPKVTPQLEATLEFQTENANDQYRMRMFHAAGDSLVFAEETLSYDRKDIPGPPQEISLGTGHQETRIGEEADRGNPTARVFRSLLSRCRVYHFHDTSPTARVRQYHYLDNDRWLMPDAANIAPLLYRWQEENRSAYELVVATIRQVAPFFDTFVLDPKRDKDIILNWRHRESDLIFGPHQLSDGTLRAICLISLLLHPHDELPDLIVVDEPEIGLHPYALHVVAELLGAAAHHTQVLISTQSSRLLDHFEPDDVVVVERRNNASEFSRANQGQLAEWLEEYSLGEVWEKNVLGGGPH